MKYAGTIMIVNEDGESVHERELDADEMIEELLTTERAIEEEAEEEPEATPVPAPQKTKEVAPKKDGKNKGYACKKCGEHGHNAKTCGRTEKAAVRTQAQEEVDADVRLRVKRLVDGGIPFDEIKASLSRAGIHDYNDRELEEMIAWAEHGK